MPDPNRPPEGQEPDGSLSAAETTWERSPGNSARPEVPPPEHIGAYRIERSLGRGGMGEVFLAWDERLGRRVAIKRIRQDVDPFPMQRERFRREARAAAGLSHPAIVQVYDLVSDAAGDAMVLEYVEGATLAERLAGGPLAPAKAVRFGRQIAEGLAVAHEAGVIHRDLKAENVILTPAGQAKILDFGLSRPMIPPADEADLTQRGALLGTYHAMSPEQAGGSEVDERSDLFSLGALLYQMLTGRAPFRGKNALETLTRVITEDPPSLRVVRPDLPAELGVLLDHLLAKDRGDRPRSARSVVATLAGIEARLGEADATDSLSDLPIGSVEVVTEAFPPRALAPVQTHPTSTLGLSLRYRRRYGVALALVAVLAAVAWMFLGRVPSRVLRVVVAPPQVIPVAGDSHLGLAASGVLSSALSSLASMEGIAAIDLQEAGGGGSSPVQMAKAVGADEVLTATLEREEGTLGRVSLRRIQGGDGRVLWAETFKVPLDSESLRLLADAVAVHLRRAWPGQRLRSGTPELEVRDEDYAAFLEVKERIDAGTTELDPELVRLEQIARSSPRFLEAHLLGARVAISLFRTWPNRPYLDRAVPLVRQAKALAPNDPRPLLQELQIALVTSREKEAEAILATLERLLPGDPEVLLQRARLAEQQGRLDAALADLRTAAERTPSWRNLYWLGRFEARRGQIVAARQHLEAALHLAPESDWVLVELAQLEMDHGDLAQAERLFVELVRAAPTPDRCGNLGAVRFLRGRFEEAATALRQGLELDPNHAILHLNLAGVEIELGREPAARDHLRQALALLDQEEAAHGPSPATGMARAECLARLGRPREAAALVQEMLRYSPDEPDHRFDAALVYSLIGDRNSALSNAQAALEKGKSPRWFTGSAFRSLLASPEMQELLAAAGASDS